MTSRDRQRYSRQILFAGLGEEGQARILAGKAAIVGCGALGTHQADALARAGAGRLLLIDRDYVELANLHRQCLYKESDAEEGLPKAVAAARRLAEVNSDIEVVPAVADLTAANVAELLGDADVVLDGSDNFETRYLINDFCVSRAIPWVYGGAVASMGAVMPVLPGVTACLKCLFPVPPPGGAATCETIGVLNTVPALVASIQASEALKILAGKLDAVSRRLTTVDVWTGVVRQVLQPAADPDCLACSLHDFIHLNGGHRTPITLCGRNAVQIHEISGPVDLEALGRRLMPLGEVRANEFALRFWAPPYVLTVFPDGRAIIKGTSDTGVARSLYARYVGN
jgi:adenylyltransferase/sulfurtransferase